MYSRNYPSPRYQALLTLYQQMHREGDSSQKKITEKTFPGLNAIREAPKIKKLIDKYNAITLLDYGCGKGLQYELQPVTLSNGEEWPSLLEYWNLDEAYCYDPAYKPFNVLPDQLFDGVICTDVLEHIPEEDIPWILKELFTHASKFVYANIACYPAQKTLPDGQNAHCTVKPVDWWTQQFQLASEDSAIIYWEIWLQKRISPGKLVESSVSNDMAG